MEGHHLNWPIMSAVYSQNLNFVLYGLTILLNRSDAAYGVKTRHVFYKQSNNYKNGQEAQKGQEKYTTSD